MGRTGVRWWGGSTGSVLGPPWTYGAGKEGGQVSNEGLVGTNLRLMISGSSGAQGISQTGKIGVLMTWADSAVEGGPGGEGEGERRREEGRRGV